VLIIIYKQDKIEFIQGNVISSEYTNTEYVYNKTRQNLQQFKSAYLMHIKKS
jgi:hypothetical protein